MQIGFIAMEAGRTPKNTHDSMYCLLISFLLSILPSGCCFPAEKGLQCPCTHGWWFRFEDTGHIICALSGVHCTLRPGSWNTLCICLELPNKCTMVIYPGTHIQLQKTSVAPSLHHIQLQNAIIFSSLHHIQLLSTNIFSWLHHVQLQNTRR